MGSSNIRFKGQLRTYIMWPVWTTIFVAVLAVAMYFVNVRAGAVATVFAVVYAAVVIFLY